jgi:hypothetical protein
MKADEIVNDYRTLLKSVSDKVHRIEVPQLRDAGLEHKARGMALIHARIEHLPADDVWQQAVARGRSLDQRVVAMREVDQILVNFVVHSAPQDVGSVMGRLNYLIGSLPGDDPTDF